MKLSNLNQSAGFIGAGALLLWASSYVGTPNFLATSAAVDPVWLSPQFMRTPEGFTNGARDNAEKSVQRKLRLERNRDYYVAFEISSSAGAADMVADFNGKGYDNDEQEFHFRLEPGPSRRVFHRLNSGQDAPTTAWLRIFYYSPATVTIRNVDVLYYPPLPGWLRSLLTQPGPLRWLLLAGGAFCLVFGLFAVFRSRGSLFVRRLRESAPGRARAADAPWALPSLLFLTFVLLISRNLGLAFPFVFADETKYAWLARYFHAPWALGVNDLMDRMPNSLYFATFHWAFLSSEGYLQAARFINAIFFILLLYFVYRTSRLFLRSDLALLTTALTALSPASSYVVYFMPEAMYGAGIWLFFWVFLSRIDRRLLAGGVFGGLVLGAVSLVKPHALVFLIVITFFFPLYKLRRPNESPWWRVVLSLVLFFAGCAASRYFLSALLSSGHIADVGGYYASMVQKNVGFGSMGGVWSLLAGHLWRLFSTYSLPVATLVASLFLLPMVEDEQEQRRTVGPLALFTALSLLVFIWTTSKFTVDVAGQGPFEAPNRIHGRYYFFLLPLLTLVFLAVYQRLNFALAKVRVVFALVCCSMAGLGAYAILFGNRNYTTGFADLPDTLWLVSAGPTVRWGAALLCVGLLGWYGLRRPKSVALFALGLALTSLLGTLHVSGVLRDVESSPAQRAAAVFRALIPTGAVDQGVIVAGTPDVEVYRFLFDLPTASRVIAWWGPGPAESLTEPASVPWVINLSDRKVDFRYRESFVSGPYHLYLRDPSGLLGQTAEQAPDPLPALAPQFSTRVKPTSPAGDVCANAEFSGFYAPETWGRWSSSPVAEVRFASSVRGDLTIRMLARRLTNSDGESLKVRFVNSRAVVIRGGSG